ncbi:MAG: lysylphosphatidylglycerol synthase transmembrane domain-containing protein [Elusimicrobiota bacterium]
MKRVEKILLAVGVLAFGLLAWKMPWPSVAWALRSVGIGFILIFAQEIVAHILNAAGWAAAFLPEHRSMVPSFWRLLKLRIAGDGVHYLIPSALVAGEMAKASMIGRDHPIASRLSSLVVSKFTQVLAFALVSAGSLWLIASGRLSLQAFGGGRNAGMVLLGVLIILLIALELRAWRSGKDTGHKKPEPQGWRSVVKMVDQDARVFLRRHPGLFLLSVLCFTLAYLWGAFEAYLIMRFLGLPVSVETALIIELLSASVDGVFFMVPAKAGTQEISKTAIFTALGLPKTAGFAFGLIRHAREILWALIGTALYYDERRSITPRP